MKIIYRLAMAVVVALMAAATAAAQVNGQMKLSYCDGQVASSSSLGSPNEGTVEAACYIPAGMVSSYRNLRVAAIRAGLASKLNVQTLTVWIRESLDGHNIMECSVSKGGGLAKGWNLLTADAPTSVSNQGFYVGYTITQTGGSYPISAVGDDHSGALYMNTGTGWEDLYGADYGCLSIETIIEADNLPKFDLALNSLGAPALVSKGKEDDWSVHVTNQASVTVESFDILLDVEGAPQQTITLNETLLPCEHRDFTFRFTPDLQKRARNVAIRATVVNPLADDENPSDNVSNGSFDFDELDFTRSVLVEEFTTEKCVNCPRAAATIAEVIHDPDYAGKVNVACHHAGYYTDHLTNDADNAYLWFYDGGSFAPGILYDRTSTVQSVGDTGSVAAIIDERMAVKGGVSFSVNASYDPASDSVNVRLDGGCDWDKSADPLYATVYLMENDVAAKKQAGGDADYRHQHVVRQYNATWGEQLSFDADEKFTYSCSLPMNEEYNRDNMEVIAFVHRYDSHDKRSCRVENSAKAAIEWNGNGVDGITNDAPEALSTEYYDLTGCPVGCPSGFVIKVTRMSDGSVRTEKTHVNP